MAKFVHQALVRREVAVGLIEGAPKRRHRARRRVRMDEARKKATEFPRHDAPLEIMRSAPLGN
eukprot:4463609-Pyramimonas_sp.AAC.1